MVEAGVKCSYYFYSCHNKLWWTCPLLLQADKVYRGRIQKKKHGACTVRGAGDRCCQFRISTCTVFISESVVAPLLTPVTGARRRQQSLPAECGQLPCPGPSSNPGRGKYNFLLGSTLKQFKVLYDIKNKFVWMKSFFCC